MTNLFPNDRNDKDSGYDIGAAIDNIPSTPNSTIDASYFVVPSYLN